MPCDTSSPRRGRQVLEAKHPSSREDAHGPCGGHGTLSGKGSLDFAVLSSHSRCDAGAWARSLFPWAQSPRPIQAALAPHTQTSLQSCLWKLGPTPKVHILSSTELSTFPNNSAAVPRDRQPAGAGTAQHAGDLVT